MRYRSTFKLLLIVVFLLSGCSDGQTGNQTKVELHVLSAASLSETMLEIERAFESDHPEIDIILNFASSGTLQRQIEQGAPADFFLSASEDKFDSLKKKNLIHPDYEKSLLKNKLVLITKKSTDTSVEELTNLKNTDIQRISIGVPESVPAGQYAKETLEQSNIWTAVQDKLVYAKDVRQVLTYVETGNVDIGFVYETDAKSSSKIKVLQTIDSALHTNIIYPAGIIKDTIHLEETKTFFTFLQNKEAQITFREFGFTPID